jgi:hypothetical protein
MNIDWHGIISIISLVGIIIIIPQIIITYIIGTLFHLQLRLIKRIEMSFLIIMLFAHFWAMAVLIIVMIIIILACGLMLNGRRTLYLLACLFHIRWLAMLAADETLFIE